MILAALTVPQALAGIALVVLLGSVAAFCRFPR